jgi:hypothetical protein
MLPWASPSQGSPAASLARDFARTPPTRFCNPQPRDRRRRRLGVSLGRHLAPPQPGEPGRERNNPHRVSHQQIPDRSSRPSSGLIASPRAASCITAADRHSFGRLAELYLSAAREVLSVPSVRATQNHAISGLSKFPLLQIGFFLPLITKKRKKLVNLHRDLQKRRKRLKKTSFFFFVLSSP